MTSFRLLPILTVLTLLSGTTVTALAADTAGPEQIPVLETISVESSRIVETTGMVTIYRDQIEHLPTRNGSVNEIIGIVPGVQYGEDYLNSFTAGEIEPPGVSISGSRIYDNNYTIDGLSNNSLVDPGYSGIKEINKLPGHPQSQFLSPRLIEQVTIYNSNIPAEFGGFTGGQIDVITIDPLLQLSSELSYRTTNDNWTQFHISPDDEDDFNSSDETGYQPQFQKHDGGFLVSVPVNSDTAFITSYQQKYSRIPLRNLDGTTTQTRKHENFFFKLAHDFSLLHRLSLTALYSPTTGKYFLTDYKNGSYKLNRDNYSLVINSEHDLQLGLLNLTLGYNGQKSERQGSANRFRWDTSTSTIDWDSGLEGSLGNLRTGHDQFIAKADFEFADISLGQTDHRVKLGTELAHTTRYYQRPEDNYYYYSDEIGNITCTTGDPACIEDGDTGQYLTRRTHYFKADSEDELLDLSAYLQDSFVIKRLEVFPGVRASYDNITEDINLAPRLSVSYDLFGNRNTILFAGKNRYYSGTLHTYELYKALYYENETRLTQNDPWIATDNYIRKATDIDTPYSDENTIGLIQRVLGGELKLQYIEKKNRDEIAVSKDTTLREYTLNNNGRTDHESFQFSWQRSWKDQYLEINSTWQKTKSNFIYYESELDDEDLSLTFWLDGKEYFKYEDPREDFNRPFVANLIYSIDLPRGISFTNVTRYRGAYTWLSVARDEDNRPITNPSILSPDQTRDPYVYERVHHKRALTYDWKFAWTFPSPDQQKATLTIDVLNVFNRKANYGAGVDDYELGRQIWAGLNYKF